MVVLKYSSVKIVPILLVTKHARVANFQFSGQWIRGGGGRETKAWILQSSELFGFYSDEELGDEEMEM